MDDSSLFFTYSSTAGQFLRLRHSPGSDLGVVHLSPAGMKEVFIKTCFVKYLFFTLYNYKRNSGNKSRKNIISALYGLFAYYKLLHYVKECLLINGHFKLCDSNLGNGS